MKDPSTEMSLNDAWYACHWDWISYMDDPALVKTSRSVKNMGYESTAFSAPW